MTRSPRILVVEDDEASRQRIRRAFEAAGAGAPRLDFVSTGQVMRSAAPPGGFDAALINLAPDPAAALRAARRLREAMPDAALAALAPSVGFMAPVETLELGLWPLVIMDEDGARSLPYAVLSLAAAGKDGFDSGRLGDLRRRNIELRDITDSLARQSVNLIRLRNELAAEKSKMETVIRGMTDGMIFFNTGGKPEIINPVAAELFPDLGGAGGAGLEEFLASLEKNAPRGGPGAEDGVETFEARIGARTYMARMTPVAGPDGEDAGALILFTDITRDKEYQRLKDEFTSMISHELRTPLTSIRAAVDNLTRGSLGSVTESQRKFMDIIGRNVDRQERLIDDLLNLARLEAGQMELALERTSLPPAAAFCVDQFSLAFKDKGVALSLEAEEGLPKVDIDPGLMAQAMDNLLSNALKFTEKGGRTTVRLGRGTQDGAPAVVVEVEDTGEGIPPAFMERIFDKYTQADSSIRRRHAGTGLGLAICREIMRAHNGSITVESEPGKGSRFRLTLPVPADTGV